jgi:hypothetical protein
MTKRFLACLSALFLCAFMSGCETMSPDECKLANWNDVGLRDGLEGKTLSLLDERVKDCSKAGSRVDTSAYLAGRDRGLQSFCRLENAVPLGLGGKGYAGVCPARVDYEFRRLHQAGYAVHDLRGRVSDLDGRSDRLQRKLREADRDEDKQLKAADKDDDRKRIRKEFDERRRHIRNELGDLDRALRRARDDLRAAEYALDHLR